MSNPTLIITTRTRSLQYGYGLRDSAVVPCGPKGGPASILRQAAEARQDMTSQPGLTNSGAQWWERLFVDGVAVEVDDTVPLCMEMLLHCGDCSVTVEPSLD